MIIEIIRGLLANLSMLDTPERIAAIGALFVNLSALAAIGWIEGRRTHPQQREEMPKLRDAA